LADLTFSVSYESFELVPRSQNVTFSCMA